jgi:recombinational DNA repair protein (RecF pathway)
MDGRSHIETRFLVLRLTPFSDSSLVAAGVSPGLGQLRFLVRGARRLGPRQFPLLDLFRVLRVTFRDASGELHRLASADLVADYGCLAQSFPAFQAAGWLARFALANVPAGLEHEALFAALCLGLERLAGGGPGGNAQALADSVVTGVLLTYLQEGGWLAEQERNGRAAAQCRALLEMAAGRCPPPRLTATNWQDLRHWALGLAQAAECELPAQS